MRTGYAFSQVSWIHRRDPEKIFFRENISTIIYGGVIPLLALGLSVWTKGASLLLFGIYLILFWRIYLKERERWTKSESCLYAASCIFAKFPGFLGACKFYLKL